MKKLLFLLCLLPSVCLAQDAEIERMQIDSVNLGGKHIKPKEITTGKLNLLGDFSISSAKKFYFDGGLNTFIQKNADSPSSILVQVDGTASFIFGASGQYSYSYRTLNPSADNQFALGSNGVRWSAVWAANGTIQTSVSKTKKDITELTSDKIIIPEAATYLRKTDTHTLKHIGFIADSLPEECFAVYYDTITETYKRSTEDVYTDSVIGILCGKVTELEKRIEALEK